MFGVLLVALDGFKFDFGPSEGVVGPIDIWVECSKPWVAEYEIVFAEVGDVEALPC